MTDRGSDGQLASTRFSLIKMTTRIATRPDWAEIQIGLHQIGPETRGQPTPWPAASHQALVPVSSPFQVNAHRKASEAFAVFTVRMLACLKLWCCVTCISYVLLSSAHCAYSGSIQSDPPAPADEYPTPDGKLVVFAAEGHAIDPMTFRVGLAASFSVLGLLSQEHSAIFSAHQALASLRGKPDCFQKALAAFELQCGEYFRGDQIQKIQSESKAHNSCYWLAALTNLPLRPLAAAVALTQCDLSTANQHLPSECQGISSKPPQSSLSRCIEAISRSPQQWSTYSGYTRELPSLCFALRREKDVNDAQRLYEDMAQEKQALLKALHRMHTSSEAERKRAVAAMNDQLASLKELVTRLHTTAEEAHEASELVAASAAQSFKASVSNALKQAQEARQGALDVLSQQLPDWISRTMESELHRVLQVHAEDLSVMISSKLGTALTDLQYGLAEHHRKSNAQAAELSASLVASQSIVAEITTALIQIKAAASESVHALTHHQQALQDMPSLDIDRLERLDALLTRMEGVGQQELQRWEREEEHRRERDRRSVLTRVILNVFGLDEDRGSSLTRAVVSATPLAKALFLSGPGPLHILVAIVIGIFKLGWTAISLMITIWLLVLALSTRLLRPLAKRLSSWMEGSIRTASLRAARATRGEQARDECEKEEEEEVEELVAMEDIDIKIERPSTPACDEDPINESDDPFSSPSLATRRAQSLATCGSVAQHVL